jgi:small nuclear ribonucleoprotein E
LWTWKGFDEFMNLVVDDAIEVTLATKQEPESRRELGNYRPELDLVSAKRSQV